MRIERRFFADDGTEFENEFKCRLYEEELAQPRRNALKDYIIFFGTGGDVMPYSPFRTPAYVFVKKLPDNDKILELWNEVVPDILDDEINSMEELGWYYENEYERWKSLNHSKKRILQIEEKLNKLLEKI